MAKKKTGQNFFSKNNLKLKEITPLTTNQNRFFVEYETGNHLLGAGCPGTGKTFLAIYNALRDMIHGGQPYRQIVIMRSVVPGREIGFLPGTAEEKAAAYEPPYVEIFAELFGNPNAYQILKDEGAVLFTTTSFLRGITFRDKIVIVDEFQNMTFEELNTVVTRIGDRCKVVFCGDFWQNDLTKKRNDESGYYKFREILSQVPGFSFITFTVDDIVRSKLVKDYIISRIKYEEARE